MTCTCAEINSRHCQYHQALADLEKENAELKAALATAISESNRIVTDLARANVELKARIKELEERLYVANTELGRG